MSNWLLPFLISTKFSIISFTWIKLSFTFLALLLSTKRAAFRIIFCRAYHFLSNQFVPEKNLLLKIKWKKFSFANKLNCKWKLEIKLLKNAICKNKYFWLLFFIDYCNQPWQTFCMIQKKLWNNILKFVVPKSTYTFFIWVPFLNYCPFY